MKAIRRLQRHGTGKEIRVPVPVCKELRARAGDYVSFDWEAGDGSVKLSKVSFGEKRDGETKEAQAAIPAAISTR